MEKCFFPSSSTVLSGPGQAQDSDVVLSKEVAAHRPGIFTSDSAQAGSCS
jgi:hypothetical protein